MLSTRFEETLDLTVDVAFRLLCTPVYGTVYDQRTGRHCYLLVHSVRSFTFVFVTSSHPSVAVGSMKLCTVIGVSFASLESLS